MTPVEFTPAMLAYLAALWLAIGRDSRIAVALGACWGVGQAGVMLNGGYAPLLLFGVADFVTAMHLALRVGTVEAKRVAFFSIPMIAVNAAAYAQANPPLNWHYTVLFGLAWAQVLVAVWGAHGGGFIEIVDNISRRFGVSFNFMGNNKGKGARR